MTAPGDFSSGDVLTAADMNDLPAGIVDVVATTTDVTLSTSAQDVFSVSFTPTGTRRIAVMCFVGSLDQPSTTNVAIFHLRDGASGTGNLLNQAVIGMGPPTHQIAWMSHYMTISAATTFYFNAYSNTGTLRMNTDSTKPMQMYIIDLGSA